MMNVGLSVKNQMIENIAKLEFLLVQVIVKVIRQASKNGEYLDIKNYSCKKLNW